jgi:hypothetical protein
MKYLLFVMLLALLPLLSKSQTWGFTIHGQSCAVIQNCTTTTGNYSFNFKGFPQKDFDGSSTLEMHMFYSGPDGGNTGGQGMIVDITSDNVPVNFSFSGPITDCYLMDPENSGPKCCGNVWYEMGAIGFVPCTVNLPLQLSFIAIRNNALVWTTDWTVNVDHFLVQGSNGNAWDSVGEVPAINSQAQTSYSFRLPDNTSQAAYGAIIGILLILGAMRGKWRVQLACVMLCVVLAHCTKSRLDTVKPAYKFFRLAEIDQGSPKVVWYSEVLQMH